MSTLIIEELEEEWKQAEDGFSAGVDFKNWLAVQVGQLRFELASETRWVNHYFEKWQASDVHDEKVIAWLNTNTGGVSLTKGSENDAPLFRRDISQNVKRSGKV